MLKELRKKAGMTQFELAVRSGVNYSTICKWEQKGVGTAQARLLKKVAVALGCKVDDLIS